MGLLAQRPEVLARLREETLAKLGTSKTPTCNDLRDMQYLRAVITVGKSYFYERFTHKVNSKQTYACIHLCEVA